MLYYYFLTGSAPFPVFLRGFAASLHWGLEGDIIPQAEGDNIPLGSEYPPRGIRMRDIPNACSNVMTKKSPNADLTGWPT